MSKKSRDAILSNLSKVLDPPSPRRRGANLDGLLNEYAPPEQEKTTRPSPAPDPSPSPSLSSNASLPPPVSHASGVSLTPNASHTPSESLAPEPPEALRGESLVSHGSLTPDAWQDETTVDLWAGVGELHTGFLRLYGVIVERLYRHLDPFEQAVYTQLFALSWGFGNPSCRVSWPKLAERSGMKQTAAFNAVKRLASKGMVRKGAPTLGKGKEQGGEFWLPLPERLAEDVRLARGRRLTPNVSNKEKDLKEKSKKGINRLTPEEIQSYTLAVADMLREGQPLEQVEAKIAPTMHAVDWATIRSTALASAGVKG